MANQGDFSSGDVLTAADLNAFSQVTVCRNTISVPNATNTTPVFTTELIDVGGWHSSGSAYIVVPYDGVYTVTANVYNLLSNNRGLVDIRNQTQSSIVASSDNATGANDLSAVVTTTANAGDNFGCVIFQNSGSTKSPIVTFSVQLIRRT